MRFSEAFHIDRGPEDDWFDPHLTVDTRLFIDPLLLMFGGDEWLSAHEELIAHFVHCYELVAKSTSPTSTSARAARRLLTFPEPAEFGLGYTAGSTSGAGSGDGFATQIADGIAVAIAKGLDHPQHIEEIGILNVGIGADRISDAVSNVLKARFIRYTQEVARRHDIPLHPQKVAHTQVVLEAGRWLDEVVELPVNPETGAPMVLLPSRLLNDLPTLNAADWFDSHLNADIRMQLNLQVGARVRKEDIVQYAREYPDRVREWAAEQQSRPDLPGYNFRADPLGVIQWDGAPVRFAVQHPLSLSAPPSTQPELHSLVSQMLDRYKHYIEQQHGWSLLWNDDKTEKDEEAAQLVFLGMAQHYLRLFGVEVDREVYLGRGPVDFKISSGVTIKLLIEVKKVHSGKFWNGLEAQLPSYLISDDCEEGWYVAVRYRDSKGSADRIKKLPSAVSAAAVTTGKSLHFSVIDGRPKVSASNLKVPPTP